MLNETSPQRNKLVELDETVMFKGKALVGLIETFLGKLDIGNPHYRHLVLIMWTASRLEQGTHRLAEDQTKFDTTITKCRQDIYELVITECERLSCEPPMSRLKKGIALLAKDGLTASAKLVEDVTVLKKDSAVLTACASKLAADATLVHGEVHMLDLISIMLFTQEFADTVAQLCKMVFVDAKQFECDITSTCED